MSTEVWKPVIGTKNRYFVSDHGRVKGPLKILKPTLMKVGYYSVALSLGDFKVIRRYVHRLVVESFIGPLPKDRVVHHKDHNKLNNQLSNLELIDRATNGRHWAKQGRSNKAGRKRSGFCGRGHKLIEERTYCLECMRLKKNGHKFFPPDDVEWNRISVPGYLISADGRLWSNKTQRILKGALNKGGYVYYNVSDLGKSILLSAHRLVAKGFIKHIAHDMVVDHIDGNKTNNRVENLRIVSRSSNIQFSRDRKRNNNTHGFKLDDRLVVNLKRDLIDGKMTQVEIAEKYAISKSHVTSIKKGRAWAHLSPKNSK